MNLEKKFLWTWKAIRAPSLEPEFRFHPLRKWRFDFAHVKSGVAIEIEGGVWVKGRHTTPSGFIKDIEKYNEAALLGWTVFRLAGVHINVQQLEAIAEFIRKRLLFIPRSAA